MSCGRNMTNAAGSRRLSALTVCLTNPAADVLVQFDPVLCAWNPFYSCRQVRWNAYSTAASSSTIPCAWACSNELSPNGQNSSIIRYKNTRTLGAPAIKIANELLALGGLYPVSHSRSGAVAHACWCRSYRSGENAVCCTKDGGRCSFVLCCIVLNCFIRLCYQHGWILGILIIPLNIVCCFLAPAICLCVTHSSFWIWYWFAVMQRMAL